MTAYCEIFDRLLDLKGVEFDLEISKEVACQLKAMEVIQLRVCGMQNITTCERLPYNSFLIRQLSLTNNSKND